MAVHLSRESVTANHQDLQANTMAIDWKGQLAVLAGRRSVSIINLDKPTEIAKRITRKQLKYGASIAEWNPTSAAGQYFAVAIGEKTDLFSSSEGTITNEKSLKTHTRNVTDLNWHKSDPSILATCSIDTFIYIWDTRETRMPSASISGLTGASQVKWSKLDPNILASADDCNIRIWDRRKFSQPVCYLTAQVSKVHCIDWSPHQENCLVSSNDTNIKFFDINNPKKEELFTTAHGPVWRARYTPFGGGIVTVVVPPLRRGDNALLLWSVLDKSGPVHTFHGHSDVVLEFGWRTGDHSNASVQPTDYQMVTWSRDQVLRIWKLDPQLLKVCGQDICEEEAIVADETLEVASDTDTILGSDIECATPASSQLLFQATQNDPCVSAKCCTTGLSSCNGTSEESDNSTTANGQLHPTSLPIGRSTTNGSNNLVISQSPIIELSSFFNHNSFGASSSATRIAPPSHLSHSLQQEFISLKSLRESYRQNELEISPDEDKRTCQISVRYGPTVAVLYIMFPLSYPRISPPSFKFLNGTNLDIGSRRELLKSLKHISSQSLKKKKGCLENCIKELILQVKFFSKSDERSSLSDGVGSLNIHLHQLYGGQQDFRIPFPRTSGARFCSSGKLICFARPTVLGTGGATERDTPRSLSALRANVKTLMGSSTPTSPKYNYIYSIGQSPAENDISVSEFYFQVWKLGNKKSKKDNELKIRAGNVRVYDVSALVPISKDIATSYALSEEDISSICNKNRDAAALAGRKDLIQVWSSAALIASSSKWSPRAKELSSPLAFHPFGRKMITSLIDYYLKSYDVQTAAMLCCVFCDKSHQVNPFSSWRHKSEQSGTGGSPYKTIHGINTEGLDMSRVRHCRSNSEGSLAEVTSRPPLEYAIALDETNSSQEKEDTSFLDPSRTNQYNEIRRAYADILYRWDLLEQRAMVAKCIQTAPPPHVGVDFQIECHHCSQSCRHPICPSCKKYSFMCAICHLPVRGCSNFCNSCGHGGHMYHMDDWFTDNSECPTGCGCQCLKEMEAFVR